MRILIILWVVFSSLIFSSQTVHAMWGSEAQPIAKEVNSLLRSTTTDGAGGAIISWDRGGPTARIEIQRIDASGDILWQKNGIGVSSSMRQQVGPGVLNDGLVNTIVVWTERELQWGRYPIANSADIYAQKIDGSGNLLWGPEGIQITNIQNSDQTFSGMVSDGNGGAFIAWMDYRNGNPDVYMQHIDNNGSLLWDVNGVPICTTPDTQGGILMTPDDSGGVVIAWNDYRNGVFNIYAQRIDTSGNYLWQSNGIQVATARITTDEGFRLWWAGSSIASDGAGGAIIVWPDITSGYYKRALFAQRVDGDGNMKWGNNGKQISSDGSYWGETNPYEPAVASDEDGGAFILWNDRAGKYGAGRVVARRIDNNGNFPWGASERVVFENEPWWGVSVSSVISDGQGGGIVAFGAQNPCHGYESDVYTQRFDSAGNTLWNPKGVNASNLPSSDYSGGLVSDGKGGIITAWQNWDSYWYIYAQHVSKDGQVAGDRTVAPPTNLEVTKNDKDVSLTWNLSSNDAQSVGYNIYRSLNNGAFSYIGSVKAGVNTFTDLTTSVDLDYCYVVRASNGCEESADSNRACTVSNQTPLASAGIDQTIECAGPSGASVTLNGSASSDPDGDPLTYTWTWSGGSAEGVNPTVSFPLGTTTVTLTVSDGKDTATDTVNITVQDKTPPVTTATGGSDSDNWYNANVISTFSATDSCSGGKEIHYTLNGAETVVPGSSTSVVITSEGTNDITYYAVDNAGNIESLKGMTIKIDRTPPVLDLSTNPNILWSPNHEMIDVLISGSATDAASGIGTVTFSVTDEYGIIQPSISNFNATIQLEASREGSDEDGRLYTISAVASDVAGNITTTSTTVLVPHDQGN